MGGGGKSLWLDVGWGPQQPPHSVSVVAHPSRARAGGKREPFSSGLLLIVSLAVYERTLLRIYERTSMSVCSYIPSVVFARCYCYSKTCPFAVLFTLGFRHVVGSVFCEGKGVA